MRLKKTYDGHSLKEIKEKHKGYDSLVYSRYKGMGDFGVTIIEKGKEYFYRDDMPLKERSVKAKYYNYTGVITNIDFSCEVFVNGQSIETTSKHRAKIYLSLYKKGIEIDKNYLTSTRNIKAFLNPSEKNKKISEINALVHSIIEDSGTDAHKLRNSIRHYAYLYGIEAAKEKYLV